MATSRRSAARGAEVTTFARSPHAGTLTAVVAAWTILVSIVAGYLLANRDGVLWGYGLPVGHDFHVFYTAACAAMDGRLADIFVPDNLWTLARHYVGAEFPTNGLWLYPPHYLLLLAPLASLSYLNAYAAFVLVTLAAYLVAGWCLGLGGRGLAVLAIAPTTLFTIVSGQNGLLTGALLVAGVMWMRDKPILSGVLLGVLTIKPHLGLLVVVALLASRAWLATGVAVASTAVLAALATAAYGVDAWTAPIRYTLPTLTQAVGSVASYWATGFASVYPHAALLVGPGPFAWLLQVIAGASACVVTYRVCRRSTSPAERAVIVSIGTMLTFPYLFFYDLPMVTLAAAVYLSTGAALHTRDLVVAAMLAITPMLVVSGVPMLAPAALGAALIYWWRRVETATGGRSRAVSEGEDVEAVACVERVSPRRSGASTSAPAAVPPPPRVVYAVAIAVAAMLVYANALSGPFILDDEAAIVANPAIRSFASTLDAPRDTPLAGRPVVALTFAANYALGGLSGGGYHVVNVAIHAGCALLLFAIVAHTLALPGLERFRSRGQDLALAIGLIWAVHPLNSEAVNYLTQRTESLMAFFFLLTLYASVRTCDSHRHKMWQAVAVVSCAVGMACKETMAVAPILVVLYDRAFVFRSFRDAVRRRFGLYGALAASWLVLLYLVSLGPRTGSTGFGTAISPIDYLLNQTIVVVRYLRLAFWPSDLVVNYGPPRALTLVDVWPNVIVLCVLLGAAVVAWWRKPAVGFLAVWIAITLAPTSSVLPIATQMAAERRMYLPMAGLVTLVVIGLYAVARGDARASRSTAGVVLAAVLLALAAGTFVRNREYASALLLAQTVLQRWPSDVAHGMVGAELVRAGRDDEAIEHLRVGARSDATARYNLGVALYNSRRFDEAIVQLEGLIAAHPAREEVPWSRRLIGQAHAARGRHAEAVQSFQSALEMIPRDPVATGLLVETLRAQGVALGTSGRHADAIAAFRQAVALDPGSPSLHANLATALIDAGDLPAAAAEARQAIALDNTDAVPYDLLGRALALQGRLAEAIDQLNIAIRISPGDTMIRQDLERVLAVQRGQQGSTGQMR